MAEIITQPGPLVRQVSGNDPDRNLILSVLAKRCYRYDERGLCMLHEEPVPMQEELGMHDATGELLHDMELYPFKLKTDVVLHGHAGRGGPAQELECAVRIGSYEKRVRVIGNRRCAISDEGAVLFSKPEPFDAMPLSYRHAYGGRDQGGHAAMGNPLSHLQKYFSPEYDVSDFSLCDYPRNPAGKGYFCHWAPQSVELLELPNLEDPPDLLAPARLFAGQWDRWPAMPMPQGTGWVSPGWFPRMAYFGVVPKHDPAFDQAAEILRGFAQADIMEKKPALQKISFLAAQGASLGLQFPYLQGNEQIELINILPDIHSFIQLPGERPVIHVDGRKGNLLSTEPVLHSIKIEPFPRRVSLIWRGHNKAIRPYMDEELKTMPLRVQW
jgi:hypothetical protein